MSLVRELTFHKTYYRNYRKAMESNFQHRSSSLKFAIETLTKTQRQLSSSTFSSFKQTVNVSKQTLFNPLSGPKMLTNNDHALFFSNDDKVLTSEKHEQFILPLCEVYSDPSLTLGEQDYFFLGEFEGKNIFAASFKQTTTENKSFSLLPARDALKIANDKTAQLICRGKQLLHWHRVSLFSGCCGSPTKISQVETAKICQSCNKVIYPATFPVVIVLIEQGRRILLARSPNFVKGMYSTLAGFVDPGESCEAAVRREVAEEVGVQIKEISYFGSQAWPFPSSIMLGFRAKYAGGEICIDKKEIEDAKWFDVSELPALPHACSIARHMIDHYVNQWRFKS